MRKIFLFIFLALLIFLPTTQNTIPTFATDLDFEYVSNTTTTSGNYDKTSTDIQRVYLGGQAVGISLETKGVILIGRIDIFTENGTVNTIKNSQIQVGDTILSIQNRDIYSSKDISEVINLPDNCAKVLSMKIKRKNKIIDTILEPALDITTNSYKAGLLVREDNSGVGTVTFIRQNGRFASLGHPVYDSDSKTVLEITKGNIFKININSRTKSGKGNPGQISGNIEVPAIGTVDKNCTFGIYGYTDCLISDRLIDVLPREKVKPGKAEIYCTIDGNKVEKFDIEIVKTSKQNKPSEKGMVIKIIDKNLKNQVGGIVQGMSGSPIVQNGKLAGAVTHVFVNNSSLGYGMYADFMLQQ